MKYLLLTLMLCSTQMILADSKPSEQLSDTLAKLKNYNGLARGKVMVVGTFHFDQSVFSEENQLGLAKLRQQLAKFNPTKIIVEWEPKHQSSTDKNYSADINGQFDIDNKSNEVYQLGFRLAKQLKHKSLFLFDNQTEYIGSLKDFSFERFSQYADANDDGFYNRNEKPLIANFEYNQKLLTKLPIDLHIAALNSLQHQRINEQRMHMYEIKVGIQKSWVGPDWLGRWYQRNIRMVGNVLKVLEKDDRLLIIVGDNHKWVLDSLFDKTPDLELVSSWKYLK